jgi:thioredoxin 1
VYVCRDMADTITESTFQAEVLESSQPVLVDFWAEWCGPCHAVAPILDQISQERQLRLVKVNVDEEQGLAQRYGVMSIPTMILFEGGEAKAAAIGAQPKGMLEKSLGLAED